MNLFSQALVCLVLVSCVLCENKYSKSANEKKPKSDVDFRSLEKPFRMNKLNLLWSKARQVCFNLYIKTFEIIPNFRQYIKLARVIHEVTIRSKLLKKIDLLRSLDVYLLLQQTNIQTPVAIDCGEYPPERLTEPKLKSLYNDLMIQDKEELIQKRVKSEGGDKEGLKEAELRRKLTNIMSAYGLLHHFDPDAPKQKEHDAYNSATDDYINKSIFKDKKLNFLWLKAEASGFTHEELVALREEFGHHQEKIDEYYNLFDDDSGKEDGYKNVVNEDELDKFNEIAEHTNDETKDFIVKANLIRDKHRDLRDGYDQLQRVIAKGPNNRDFIEPKVQGLWKIAVAANFTTDELASLKVELQHYESRLLKLRRLRADHVSNTQKFEAKMSGAGDKINHFEEQEQMIKKHSRKVAKLHSDLETRIMERHTEL